MKLFGKTLAVLVCIAFFLGTVPGTVTKAYQTNTGVLSEREITVFEDGSYCISEIIVRNQFDCQLLGASAKTREATKSNKYYNSSGKLQFTTVVTARFKYDGTSARAISSNYGYKISNSAWKFLDGESYFSGDSATAVCTFSSSTETRTESVTITCSPKGVIS